MIGKSTIISTSRWDCVGLAHEWVDLNPQQRKDRCQQNRPHDDNRGSAILAAHQSFQERVKMHYDPEGKEELSEERTPRLVASIQSIWNTRNNADQVDDNQSCWRNEKSRPFKDIKLSEFGIVGSFGSDGKISVNPSQHLQEALEDGKKMGRHTTDHPKLLISPPVINANPTPPHFENARSKDGQEKRNKP